MTPAEKIAVEANAAQMADAFQRGREYRSTNRSEWVAVHHELHRRGTPHVSGSTPGSVYLWWIDRPR